MLVDFEASLVLGVCVSCELGGSLGLFVEVLLICLWYDIVSVVWLGYFCMLMFGSFRTRLWMCVVASL